MGFFEGRNVVLDRRFAQGHVERLPALATDLVLGNRAAIVAARTQHLLPRRPPGRFRLFLKSGAIPSSLDLLQASTVPAAISPASLLLAPR
jgi:hypothetical protein